MIMKYTIGIQKSDQLRRFLFSLTVGSIIRIIPASLNGAYMNDAKTGGTIENIYHVDQLS